MQSDEIKAWHRHAAGADLLAVELAADHAMSNWLARLRILVEQCDLAIWSHGPVDIERAISAAATAATELAVVTVCWPTTVEEALRQ